MKTTTQILTRIDRSPNRSRRTSVGIFSLLFLTLPCHANLSRRNAVKAKAQRRQPTACPRRFAFRQIIGHACVISILSPFSLLHSSTSPDAALSTSVSPIQIVAQTPYTVAARDGNQKVWSKTTWESNVLTGEITTETNSYVELSTGAAHLVNGAWLDSSDQIEITKTGARAINSQHKVAFLANINTTGAIDITLPEGDKHLTSCIIGLSYMDGSGKSVLIAEIKDSVGQLLPSGNQVLYPDAFTDFSADVLYINKTTGFEQLIVLRQQPPSPAEWGLDPNTTVLQVITEFFKPPTPQIIKKGSDDDQDLDFGITQMPKGVAFAFGNETNTIPVKKQWLLLDGRQCLVESTPFVRLEPLLNDLPAPPEQARLHDSPDSVLHKIATSHLLPARNLAYKTIGALRLAGARSPDKGVAIDYSTVTSQPNMTFQSDTTYYVPSSVTLSGTTKCEGGSVIKIAPTNNACLNLGTTAWSGGMYRPTIITGRDDDTVGDVISGSTSNPFTNFYGNVNGAISLSDPASSPKYLRISFAKMAMGVSALSSSWSLTHAQIMNCQKGIYSGGDDNNVFTLRNALIYNMSQLGNGNVGWIQGENLTLNQVTNGGILSTTLTNSIATACSGFSGGSSNAILSSAAGVFQTVGSAAYYLADGSAYRNAGTTNVSILSDLRTRTTYPPIVLTNAIANDTTLSAQAPQRDTDAPDIGYHYDPLDYCLSGITITNTLNLTNGVALGTYGTSGLNLGSGGKVISQGTPGNMNHLVRYQSVQEQATIWGSTASSMSLLFLNSTPTVWPEVRMRFTEISLLANSSTKRYILNNNLSSMLTNLVFVDCAIYGGALNVNFSGSSSPSPMRVALTNNLLQRPYLVLEQDTDNPECLQVQAWNNLFIGGTATIENNNGTTTWDAHDNLFDKSSLPSCAIRNSYNAYVTNFNKLPLSAGNDKILTNSPVYLTSYLGNYYYPTNDGMLSALIDAGSRNATNAVLYHYCTTTNQLKEGVSTIDIGFHYVACDSSGNPIDTDGDGVPDYLADTNGNGFLDFGEIPFGITVENPANGSVINR